MIFMDTLNWSGILLGVSAFLLIGIFHPIVIKSEYYFGTKCWWVFALCGIGFGIASLFISNTVVSAIVGVTAFSCLWSILEIFQQRERVRKGWFSANPKRTAKENKAKKQS